MGNKLNGFYSNSIFFFMLCIDTQLSRIADNDPQPDTDSKLAEYFPPGSNI
jgi:hypothetical protein